MTRWPIMAAVLAAHIACVGTSACAGNDPPVPLGSDPGGTAVALIGDGVDYTQPQISAQIARDGEGEIVGFDFVDQDRRPYAAMSSRNLTAAALIILQTNRSAQSVTRLISVRADADDLNSLAQALEFAAKTPARIIVVAGSAPARPQRGLLVAAAKLFPDKIFVVAAGDGGFDLDATTIESERDIANLVVATAVRHDGTAVRSANYGAASVDLAVAIAPDATADPANETAIAAAVIASLAVTLFQSAPDINAADVKAQLASLATPWLNNSAAIALNVSRSGWIGPNDRVPPKQN